jgi:hypothetical protein
MNIYRGILDTSGSSLTFSDMFIDLSCNNPKGVTQEERFKDIISDPSNLLIPRVAHAGTVDGRCVYLHNGIAVIKDCYYGSFSDILQINGGCHEPSEERLFAMVLPLIPEGGVMIELGSYWAFYTIWFNTQVKNARNFCIEPEQASLECGELNCSINKVSADFTEAFIGKNHLNLSDFVKEKHIEYIDILHSDIQGYELEMLSDITDLLDHAKIRYLFISTHSDELHHACISLLEEHNYRIIAKADFETETFCHDGIILACHKTNIDIPPVSLGNRKHTPLRSSPYNNYAGTSRTL